MKPSTNFRRIVPGLWCWSSLHEEYKVDFSSAAWKNRDDFVLIDPIKLDDANLAKLEKAGRPTAILLTNENHERDADWFRRRYEIKIRVHRAAVPGIEIKPDAFFDDGATVPGGLKVIHVPGISPSECAFYSEVDGGVLVVGDVVVHVKGELRFLPDQYCKDAKQNRESAKKLLGYTFETITVAHGDPIHPRAREEFTGLFAS